MPLKEKLQEELKTLGIAALYFGCWIFALLVIKWLVLAEYKIAFDGWSMTLVGALVLSKVVLVLEKVPLGAWVRNRPAWVEVVLRTIMYALGVLVVLLLEKGFEGRHAQDGFGPALRHLFQQEDIYHVWANTICLSGALLVYNAMSTVQRYLGKGGLIQIFLKPLPAETKARRKPEPGDGKRDNQTLD